jgi:hypothetical protein
MAIRLGPARWLPLVGLAAGVCAFGAPAAPGRHPAPATQPAPASQPAPRSQKLKSGLHSPMPGGRLAGYHGDTGLDIGGRFLPVYALAAGTLDYAERGHTRWRGRRDTDWTVRLKLDQPIAYKGRQVTHLYSAHLSAVAHHQPEGAPVRRRVAAGERLGTSGLANGSPHLHLGLILDGRVDQEYYADVLREWQVRELLGGYRNGALLPPLPRPPRAPARPTILNLLRPGAPRRGVNGRVDGAGGWPRHPAANRIEADDVQFRRVGALKRSASRGGTADETRRSTS